MRWECRAEQLNCCCTVEKDTLLSKLELPGSILITTADPNRSGKPGRSGGWVDLKEKVITRGGRV